MYSTILNIDDDNNNNNDKNIPWTENQNIGMKYVFVKQNKTIQNI